MKRCLMFLILVAATLLTTAGCGNGVVYSAREREFRTHENLVNDCKQFNDDWDYLWLNEQKGRLSRWDVAE